MKLDIKTIVDFVRAKPKTQSAYFSEVQVGKEASNALLTFEEPTIGRKIKIYNHGTLVKAINTLGTKLHRLGRRIRKDRKSLLIAFARIKEQREAAKQQATPKRSYSPAIDVTDKFVAEPALNKPLRRFPLIAGTSITDVIISAFAGVKHRKSAMLPKVQKVG